MPSKRPGFRTRQAPTGRFDDARVMWARCQNLEAVEYNNGPPEKGEVGDEIVLGFAKGRTLFSIGLSQLTVPELDAMKKVIDHAFEAARPVCQERDEVADNAFAQGDTSFIRSYRAVPIFVDRQGTKRLHSEGVHDGPSDDSGVLQGGQHHSGEPGTSGSGVVEPNASEGSAQDDPAPVDLPAGLRPMGGPGGVSG